jgi:hypothetical protein
MAGEVWQSGTGRYTGTASIGELKRFEALVREDERKIVMNEPLTKEMWQRFEDEIRADERNASINAVLRVIKELYPALVLAAFSNRDNAWVLNKVKESIEKLKEKPNDPRSY